MGRSRLLLFLARVPVLSLHRRDRQGGLVQRQLRYRPQRLRNPLPL